MLSFKEIAKKDIKEVFLNPKEFGEKHMVSGREMCIIIDEEELTEREKKQFGRGRDGTHQKSLLFYVAAKDFGPQPEPDQVLVLDGRNYIVIDAGNESGIYSISLEARRK